MLVLPGISIHMKLIESMNTKLVSSIGATTRSRLIKAGIDASLVDVAKLLSSTQVSLVVVCGPDGTMAGILTRTDVVQQIGQCQGARCTVTAAQWMVREVTHCLAGDRLADVMSTMASRGLVHMPVLDDHSRPVGVVNARDALRALWAEEEYEESLLRDYVMGIGYH